ELFETIGPIENRIERERQRQRDDLIADRHGLPGGVLDILLVLPCLAAAREVLHCAHGLELTQPVVPYLADVGRAARADRADQLLARLRLRDELDLDLEILLRLVEALHQRGDEGDSCRLGHAELKAHRLRTPGLARRDERGLPPREIRCGDDARPDECMQNLAPGQQPPFMHFILPSASLSGKSARSSHNASGSKSGPQTMRGIASCSAWSGSNRIDAGIKTVRELVERARGGAMA